MHGTYVKMYVALHVKYPSFLSEVNENRVFSTEGQKVFKYQIS